MTDNHPTFSNSAEEAEYWKKQAEAHQRAAKEATKELEEFQEGSRELEAELEAQLEQAESKNKELKSLSNKYAICHMSYSLCNSFSFIFILGYKWRMRI